MSPFFVVHLFDDNGRVTETSDDEGGRWQFSRMVAKSGEIVSETITAEGNLSQLIQSKSISGEEETQSITPSGDSILVRHAVDGVTTTRTDSCGSISTTTTGIDPDFGYSYVSSVVQNTPAGRQRFTGSQKTRSDTDGDGVIDTVIDTVTVNDRSLTTTDYVQDGYLVTTSPEGRMTATHYDPATLLPSRVEIPGLADTQYGFDFKGRLTSVVNGARQTLYTYTSEGFLNSVTDPEQHTTTYEHDALGRVTAVYRPDSSTIRFAYDGNGNMTVLTNSVDVDHGFGYNGVNLRSGYYPPVSGSYSYLYDKDRRLIQTNFPSGKQINNVYTGAQLTQIQTPEDYIDLTYSCGSKVASMTKGGESIGYAYDGKLLTDVTITGTLNQSLNYLYNDDFNVTAVTYAGSTEYFSYDLDSLLTEVGGYSISRNVQNGLPEFVTGNGLTINRSFNGYGELTAQTMSAYSQPLLQWNINRDNAGRIITKTEDIDGESHNYSYSYDAMGRLLTVTLDGDPVESYSYDLSGTRISETNTLRGISNRTFSYSDEDHLLTAGDAAYAYDPDGFLMSRTKDGETTIFDYSTRGELLEVQLPDNRIISYDHDPLGRRIAKRIDGVIVEKYLWQGLTKLLAVYDGSDNLIQRFEYADDRMPVGMTAEGVSYYPAYDQVGSLRIVADGSGNIVKRIDYDTFGNIISDSNPSMALPFGFAGGLHDRDIDLVRFGYRDYDPDTGRWTAKDPIGFAGGDTDLYGYVTNDPVNLIDPTGEFAVTGTIALIWAGIEFGLSIYDAWDTGKTLLDPCANGGEKAVAVGLFAAGILLPGNYGFIDDSAKVVIGKMDDIADASKFMKGEAALKLSKDSTWAENKAVLKYFMDKGKPIRDISPEKGGGFLQRERNFLLGNRWRFNSKSGYWNPPNH